MAMTLGSMTNLAMLSQSAGVSALKGDSRVTDAFAQASKRTEQKLEATNVQLSAFGQIKSGFANVQSAGKALSDPKKTGTGADVEKAVQTFAAAYNNATKTISTTAVLSAINGTNQKSGVLSNNVPAQLAANDLRSIVGSGNSLSELKKIGISINQDGAMTVDAKALQSAMQADPNAVKDTLSRVGKQAEQVSTKEMAKTGNIGGAVNTLSDRAKDLEAQSAEQQRLASASQAAVQQQSAKLGNAASSIAAYMQMFSI